jgi:hypothetical protein
MRLNLVWLLALGYALNVQAAWRLVVENAWIRTAPPGAMMLAGYATLRNAGDASLAVVSAQSEEFGDVSLHQSFEENGVERMRPLGRFEIAPDGSVTFAPGGKHFMLMRPKRELHTGDKVKIHISTSSGEGEDAEFVVREPAP